MTAQQLKPIEPEGNLSTPITPMAMISRAVANGAGVDVLERLMALQERYEANQGKKAFDQAIAAAKAEIPTIAKNRKVDFTTQKGRTNYDYEDLGEIARVVDPVIAKYGLSYRFRSKQDGINVTVTCILSHSDGYSEETSLNADNDNSGNKNSIQAIGSAVTYLQRYTLKLALGLAASKDDDGKAADPDEKISEKQLTELLDLAEQLSVDKIKFCEWAKIEAFSEIRRSEFQKAKNAILAKGRQAQKKEQANG